jgi:tetratricopeptide (TPR) repeat protein
VKLRLLFPALLLAGSAFAQVNEVDPDAVDVEQRKPANVVDPDAVEVKKRPKEDFIQPDGTSQVRSGARDGGVGATAGSSGSGKKNGKDPKAEPKPDAPAKPAAPPILVSQTSDADLQAAWDKWRAANAKNDVKAETAARNELLQLKARSGATALVPYAVGMMRAASQHQAAGDSTAAVELAQAGVELAPKVPVIRLMQARVFFEVDPTNPGRVLESFRDGVMLGVDDPRYLRPLIADLAVTFLTALMVLAAAVVGVLFLRRVRYFLHDFHFIFPRALARWQSAALAVLFLLSPIVFRMGVAPAVLLLFATVSLYLTTAERLVAWVLVAMLGAIPVVGMLAAAATSFAGTPAERTYLLEQGGPGTEALAGEVVELQKQDKASFAELSALGSWQLRRGKLDAAVDTLKSALLKRPNEARASNNLGVAMMLKGDLDNPKSLFEGSAQAEPTAGVPLFNLARLYQRRVAVLGESATGEVDRANQAMFDAKQRDPSLADRKDPPPDKLDGNVLVLTEPIAKVDLLSLTLATDAEERVGSELTQTVLGDVPENIAPFYPFVVGALLFAVGFLSLTLGAARPCAKCGAPISKRSDPDVSVGGAMCTQCVNVFAKRGVVPPSLKVRKQLEVTRFATRTERASYILGAICSGMGHVFLGSAVKGSLYGFLFVFGIVALVQRNGVLRSPYDGPPVLLVVVPIALMVAVVYGLTLRGLFRRAG